MEKNKKENQVLIAKWPPAVCCHEAPEAHLDYVELRERMRLFKKELPQEDDFDE